MGGCYSSLEEIHLRGSLGYMDDLEKIAEGLKEGSIQGMSNKETLIKKNYLKLIK
jgi:hypothetical protein